METKKCRKCGGTEFAEASDFIQIRQSKMAVRGSYKIYTFCLDCGEVDSIRIDKTKIFKKEF